MTDGQAALRIGEFARRVGVNANLLRAWERRYGLLQPVRSAGGFRLYSEQDAGRVRAMRRALADGLSAAQAAQMALGGERVPSRDPGGSAAREAGGNAAREAGGNAAREAVGNAAREAGGNAAREAGGNAAREAGGSAARAEGAPSASSPAPTGAPGVTGAAAVTGPNGTSGVDRFMLAIRAYDEPAVHGLLDESFAAYGLEATLQELVFPTLMRVGLEWSEGRLPISHEHFVTNVVRGRLMALTRLWGRGTGPLALLACVAGETHDLSLLAFGLVLRTHGWRILFLGGDTPVATIAETAEALRPQATIIAAFDASHVEAEAEGLRHLASTVPVLMSGPAAGEELCAHLGVSRLLGNFSSAAAIVALGQHA